MKHMSVETSFSFFLSIFTLLTKLNYNQWVISAEIKVKAFFVLLEEETIDWLILREKMSFFSFFFFLTDDAGYKLGQVQSSKEAEGEFYNESAAVDSSLSN